MYLRLRNSEQLGRGLARFRPAVTAQYVNAARVNPQFRVFLSASLNALPECIESIRSTEDHTDRAGHVDRIGVAWIASDKQEGSGLREHP
jgi:hypothetical protein